jgi:signal peptidase I
MVAMDSSSLMNPSTATRRSSAALQEQPTFITTTRRDMRRVQWTVGIVMLLLTVMAITRLSFVTGWWKVVRVEGASMAETFVGNHFATKCRECRFPFRCDADHPPKSGEVVCPNCGYKQNQLDDKQLVAGDRVLIDRLATLGSQPRRGDVIALRMDAASDLMGVKRVVALPGERWGIEHGDLYVNGKIHRKGLAELLDQRVLVHDNNYQPKGEKPLPPRWQPKEASNWRPVENGFVFTPRGGAFAEQADFAWLRYHHWACTGSLADRSEASTVLDNDPYNQAANRQLNAVADIMLSCRIESEPGGRFALSVEDEPHHFEVVFDRQKRNVVLNDHRMGEVAAETRERPFADARRLDLLLALCDKRVWVVEGGQVLITYDYDRVEPCEVQVPLAIAGQRGKLTVTDLRVYRDIYYLDPNGAGRKWRSSRPLARDRIAVLGDNPPLSTDSRHFEDGLPIDDVLGLVYRPFWITTPN